MKDFWTKIKDVAEEAEIDPNTYRQWKHNKKVPALNHAKLVAAAKKLRIKLTYDELNGV